MIAVVDYGAGNIHSVGRALARIGADFEVTDDPTVVDGADAVILPGVGAARDTMSGLHVRELDDAVVSDIERGAPYLGICMGLQVLFDASEEDDETPCLGVLSGRVVRFPDGLDVPHMGWNQVHQVAETPLFDGVAQDTNFYFVHSYYPRPDDPSVTAATTDYGVKFVSAAVRGNVHATQFHPEKSGPAGLRVYANFAAIAGQGAASA